MNSDKRKILVYEQELGIVESLSKLLLEQNNYELRSVSNNDEAMSAISELGGVDLVILDIDDSPDNIKNFLDELPSFGKKPTIVALGDPKNNQDVSMFQELGVDIYILKSWLNKQGLIKTIRRILSPANLI